MTTQSTTTSSSTSKEVQRPSIDIGLLAQNPDQLARLEISRPETSEERLHRLRQQTAKTYVNIAKELALFIVGIVGVALIAWICTTIILDPSANPETQKWAQSILTAIVSGVVGYLIGKSTKNDTS